jgi:TonB family protein
MFKDRKSILGTILFHGVILLIIVLFGFTTPLPLPSEEGILINFGTEETGAGDIELRFSETTAAEPAMPVMSDVTPDKETNLTQDYEEAPAIEKKEPEKTIHDKDAAPEESVRSDTKTEVQPPVEEPRKVDERALYKGRQNSDNTTEGEGITGGDSNQGNPFGSPESDNYSNISSQGTGGVNWSLDGRNPISLPKPEYKYQISGTVVVRIRVDQSGKVTSAEAGVKGSNTTDTRLLEAARLAALKARFDSNPGAPVVQQGTLTYHFILQ